PRTQISQPPLAISASTPVPATLPDPKDTSQAPKQTVLPTPGPLVQKRRPRRLFIALIAALLAVLLVSTFGAYLFYSRNTTLPPPTIVGHAFFMSSGLLGSQKSSQGITDELEINLQYLPDPQPGKGYYGWLREDNQPSLP